MTLGELLKDKTLPVKVREANWDNLYFFEARYIHNEFVYGHSKSGTPEAHGLNSSRKWRLYVEPKKKIIRYQWYHKKPKLGDGRTHPFIHFYSEDEFKKFFGDDHNFMKLEYTRTEFEE